MSTDYGNDPVSAGEESTPVITNVDGDNVVEVANAKDDDSWKYKLKDVDIPFKEANRENFKSFNRTFTTMGEVPTPEQEEKLKPILAEAFGKGFTLRSKDPSHTDQFYTWTTKIFSRVEYYMSYAKKGIKIKPILTEVSNDAIGIAMEAKVKRFPNTKVDRFKGWQDIAKQMVGLNAHIALGVDLESPLSFIILNTPSGEEIGSRIDFETIGFNQDILLLAGRYNIPLFNLNAEGGMDRLKEYVSNF